MYDRPLKYRILRYIEDAGLDTGVSALDVADEFGITREHFHVSLQALRLEEAQRVLQSDGDSWLVRWVDYRGIDVYSYLPASDQRTVDELNRRARRANGAAYLTYALAVASERSAQTNGLPDAELDAFALRKELAFENHRLVQKFGDAMNLLPVFREPISNN